MLPKTIMALATSALGSLALPISSNLSSSMAARTLEKRAKPSISWAYSLQEILQIEDAVRDAHQLASVAVSGSDSNDPVFNEIFAKYFDPKGKKFVTGKSRS